MMKFTQKTLIGLMLSATACSTVFAAESIPAQDSSISSNMAWTIQNIRFVDKGNAAKGEKLNKKMMCSVCHGDKGISTARNWPNLAGQNAHYIYKMLIDYRDHKRVDAASSSIMVKLANQLTEQQMADLSQYYASFPLPKAIPAKLATPQQVKQIMPLLDHGDGKRMIPPCLSCHSISSKIDLQDIPELAGQQAVYFRNTMQEYKSGARHDDIYSRMRDISKTLTDTEINALAQYFSEVGITSPKK